jgi:hypothetical protein
MKRRVKSSYRSTFEDKVIKELTGLGLKFDYETLKLKYSLPGRTYTPDIILANGIIVELKGYFDPEDRSKMRAVIEQHPELDIRMVFQKASKTITKTSKTTYGEWCTKNNIKWAEGSRPLEWFTE